MNHLRPLRTSTIEPLEARIAPALLVYGANFLTAGQTGETSAGDNAATLVKVTSGSAIVWFAEIDGKSVISSISVGPGTGLEITGDVVGDIVSNLTAAGRLSDSDNDPTNGEDGGVLLANEIKGIKTGPLTEQKGSIRNIITGGSIANLSINGTVEGIYSGDGVFRAESDVNEGGSAFISVAVDINPVTVAFDDGFTLTKATAQMQPGASIKNMKVETAKELQIFSGSGSPSGAAAAGAGAAGGTIEGVTISSAFIDGGDFSYMILAGDGANGASGGAGGSVLTVIEKTSNGTAMITAGQGGASSTGTGGVGGSVKNLDLQSDSSIYLVTAGAGGQGVGGGAGGSLVNANFSNKTPTGGLIVTGDFTGGDGDDVLVIDSGTGRMVLRANDGSGTDFTPVVQYVIENGPLPDDDVEVTDIEALGNTPVAALARDVNNDGLLDVIVAYRNSSSLGIYLNQGGGSFYQEVESEDPLADPTFEAVYVSVELGFTPAQLVAGNFSGDGRTDFAVLTTANNQSAAYVVEGGANDEDPTIPVFTVLEGFTAFAGAPSAAVRVEFASGFDDLIVSTTSGKLLALAATGTADGAPFTMLDTGATLAGGISALDVDSTGNHLLAVGANARVVRLFTLGNDGTLTESTSPDFTGITGKPIAARFVEADGPGADSIGVLFSLSAGSRFDLLVPGENVGDPAYVVDQSVSSTAALKTFAFAYSDSAAPGIAALGGSLSRFYFDQAFDGFEDFNLPFSGKIVIAKAGDGGLGITTAKTAGKGGAGGSISGVNAEAPEIYLTAGHGGDAQSAAGGAGGAITNPATFVTASKASVAPKITAESVLEIRAGNGGSALATGKTGSGGSGGALSGLTFSLASGSMELAAGLGGTGRGGAGGAGGSVTKLISTSIGADLLITAGAGGAALSGKFNGGAGGSITGVKHELRLDEASEAIERPYAASLVAGAGGSSAQGNGGAGGNVSEINIFLDPANDDVEAPIELQIDSTTTTFIQAGDGGEGVNGGAGGSMSKVTSRTLFDQKDEGGYYLNAVTATLLAGAGGKGTAGNGGNGGGISTVLLEGLTFFDYNSSAPEENPNQLPLLAVAGRGGDGSVKGGAGGGIVGLTAQNAKLNETLVLAYIELSGAWLDAGDGGNGATSDGGAGGSISKVLAAVSTRELVITTGTGGNGGTAGGAKAKGGAGGSLTGSTLGVVDLVSEVGIFAQLGDGGSGQAAGGAGGAMSQLVINTPQSLVSNSAVLLAGHGGAALASGGLGGKGGDINGITQTKDLNSAINVLQAGNGGAAAAGKGGAGGNVSSIKTSGFIGKPNDGADNLGAFDNFGMPQGVFSGRGGAGLTVGVAGAVSNVIARQIAAIAAAYDADSDTFGIASKVSNVTADVIGFDVDRDGVFEDDNGGSASPSGTRPLDGFILAAAIASVNATRPGFVFTA